MDSNSAWLSALFALIALLYASVGQAGASGYLATMGLFGMAHFWRSGLLSWRTFYPFAILGFPFSLIGGAVQFPTHVYYPAVGTILLLSAVQMVRTARHSATAEPTATADPPLFPLARDGRRDRFRVRFHRDGRRHFSGACHPVNELGESSPHRRHHGGL